jgi:hypothetical protein
MKDISHQANISKGQSEIQLPPKLYNPLQSINQSSIQFPLNTIIRRYHSKYHTSHLFHKLVIVYNSIYENLKIHKLNNGLFSCSGSCPNLDQWTWRWISLSVLGFTKTEKLMKRTEFDIWKEQKCKTGKVPLHHHQYLAVPPHPHLQ